MARLKYDPDLLARQLWTIGDVNRLRLLALLPTHPDCSNHKNVSELAEALNLSQPTVSNHLARLRTLGIVKCRKMCRDVHYWIDPTMAEEIVADLQDALQGSGMAVAVGRAESGPRADS